MFASIYALACVNYKWKRCVNELNPTQFFASQRMVNGTTCVLRMNWNHIKNVEGASGESSVKERCPPRFESHLPTLKCPPNDFILVPLLLSITLKSPPPKLWSIPYGSACHRPLSGSLSSPLYVDSHLSLYWDVNFFLFLNIFVLSHNLSLVACSFSFRGLPKFPRQGNSASSLDSKFQMWWNTSHLQREKNVMWKFLQN